MINGQIVEKISNAIDKRNNSVVNQVDKKYLKYKNAKVTSYDENTSITTVKFADIDHEYQYYNKSGEILQENDSVKVEYTNNLAQGIITLKYGEWRAEESTSPYITQKITNDAMSELGIIGAAVINIDFEVKDNKSDVVLNANQKLSLTEAGTTEYTYIVDGLEQRYPAQQIMSVGNNVYTHVVPMELSVGKHNIVINMKSADATGNTVVGDFYGVISGQIANVKVIAVPNINFKFVLRGVEAGTTITMIGFSSSGTNVDALINWGDRTEIVEFISNEKPSHTYENAGDYTIEMNVVSTVFYSTDILFPNWFGSLKEVYFPDGLTQFSSTTTSSSGLFMNSGLEYLSLGKSLTSLNTSFANTNLSHVDLPDTLTSLSTEAFKNTKLVSIKTPASLKASGSGTGWFYSCKSLTTADVSSDVCSEMFRDCTALKNVTINAPCSVIGNFALYRTAIENLAIPKTVQSIGSRAFEDCEELNEIKIANDSELKLINSYSFHNSNLTAINLPNGLTTIGSSAFLNCENLKKIVIPQTLSRWYDSVFEGCTSLVEAALPSNLIDIPNYTFEGCTSLKSLGQNGIPSTVTHIGNRAFINNKNLNIDITLSSNLTEWEEGCFAGSGITGITIQKMTYIPRIAFSGCNNLTYVNFAPNLININSQAFQDCISLTEIVLPNSLTTLGSSAFRGCTNVNTLILPNNLIDIQSFCFEDCVSLTEVNLPPYLTELSNSVFKDCTALTTIAFPDGLTTIGGECFRNTNLNQLSLPQSIVSIGSQAFSSAIKSGDVILHIGGTETPTLTTIANGGSGGSGYFGAFSQCSGIREVIINAKPNDGIINIGTYAFCGSGIINATLNINTHDITYATGTFYDCKNLQNVDFISDASQSPQIANSMFYRCNNLKTINNGNMLPEGVTIGSSAFYGCGFTSIDISRVLKYVTANNIAGHYAIGSGAFSNCAELSSVCGYTAKWDIMKQTRSPIYNEQGSITGYTEWEDNGIIANGVYNYMGKIGDNDSLFSGTALKTASNYTATNTTRYYNVYIT